MPLYGYVAFKILKNELNIRIDAFEDLISPYSCFSFPGLTEIFFLIFAPNYGRIV